MRGRLLPTKLPGQISEWLCDAKGELTASRGPTLQLSAEVKEEGRRKLQEEAVKRKTGYGAVMEGDERELFETDER